MMADVLNRAARARAEAPLQTLEERKQELARTLDTKLAQGYQIESQEGTNAVLLRPGRRHWFGLRPGLTVRCLISVDERGHATSRKIEE
jgi:hypothetical protein